MKCNVPEDCPNGEPDCCNECAKYKGFYQTKEYRVMYEEGRATLEDIGFIMVNWNNRTGYKRKNFCAIANRNYELLSVCCKQWHCGKGKK